jgi:hypothetical protein
MNCIPYFDRPEHMPVEYVDAYGDLARILNDRHQLTLSSASELFRSLEWLAALQVDIAAAGKYQGPVSSQVIEYFTATRRLLTDKFEAAGICEKDFQSIDAPIANPWQHGLQIQTKRLTTVSE